MALSFGGSIMTVRVENYEASMKKHHIAIRIIMTFENYMEESSSEGPKDKLKDFERIIRTRVGPAPSRRPSKAFAL